VSKIRKSARNEDCQVRIPGICTFDSTTTIWSHYRGEAGGKGMSLKSDDLCGAYACTACDAVYDGQLKAPPGMTREQIENDWLTGHIRSMRILLRKGLIKA